jgi:hypothetical protein
VFLLSTLLALSAAKVMKEIQVMVIKNYQSLNLFFHFYSHSLSAKFFRDQMKIIFQGFPLVFLSSLLYDMSIKHK